MDNNQYTFNNEHRQNIKSIFESKTGVQLSKKKTFAPKRRMIVAVLVAVLLMSVATPVLAATVPEIYELMYLVSPSVAQFFKAVQKSDIHDGIKMEVVSVYIHANIAEIYVTMQDLTGNRIDSTTDLFDSYSINRAFDCAATCKNVGYDEETQTVTFLITVTEWGNQNIEGDKITFSVREFLSQKEYYRDFEIPLDLSQISTQDETHQVYSNGGGGNGYPVGADTLLALIPSEPLPVFPVDGLDLTAIGYVDGQLHIQISNKNPLRNGNHGFFYLKTSDGITVQCDYNFYFSNQYEQLSERIDYCEYVFNIPIEGIAEYLLYGDFTISGSLTEGYWSVTFPLDQAV